MARGAAVVILSLLVSLAVAQGIRPPWPKPTEPATPPAPPAPAAPDDRTVRDYRPGQGWVDVRWDAKSRRWEPLARRDDATREVGPPPDDAEATRRRAEWSALKQRAEAAEADAVEQRRRAEQAEAGLDALVRSDAYEARGRQRAAQAQAQAQARPLGVVQPAAQMPATVSYQQPPAYQLPATISYQAPPIYQAPAPVQYQAPAGGAICPECGQSHGFRPFRRFGGFRSIPAAPP
jgi:hypothetical protein